MGNSCCRNESSNSQESSTTNTKQTGTVEKSDINIEVKEVEKDEEVDIDINIEINEVKEEECLRLPLTSGKEELLKQRYVGDPLTDDIMALEYKDGNKIDRHSMMALLALKNCDKLMNNPEKNVKFSQRILDYFNNTISYPSWFDIDRIKRGQQFAESHIFPISMGLLCYSLPFCYCMKESKTLVLTERLTKHVNSRALQTIQFVTIMFQEGSFADNGNAIRSCQTIRLIHSGARIAHKKEVESALDELPVNHLSQFFTLYGFFCIFTLDAVKKLGMDYDDQNFQDYVYLWTVIGYFLGMNNKVLLSMNQINNIEQLNQFKNDFLPFIKNESGQYHINNDTKELSKTLVEWERKILMEHIKDENGKDMIYEFWRFFMGNQYCDEIDIPQGPEFSGVLIDILKGIGFIENLIEKDDFLRKLIAHMSQKMVEKWFEHVTGGRKRLPYYLANPSSGSQD
eukprot:442974_1